MLKESLPEEGARKIKVVWVEGGSGRSRRDVTRLQTGNVGGGAKTPERGGFNGGKQDQGIKTQLPIWWSDRQGEAPNGRDAKISAAVINKRSERD